MYLPTSENYIHPGISISTLQNGWAIKIIYGNFLLIQYGSFSHNRYDAFIPDS